MSSQTLGQIRTTLKAALEASTELENIPVIASLGSRTDNTAEEDALDTQGIVLIVSPPFVISPITTSTRSSCRVKPVVILRYNHEVWQSDTGLQVDFFDILSATIKAIQSINPNSQSYKFDEEGIQLLPNDEGLLTYHLPINTNVTI